MTLQQCRYLVEIAKYNSLTKAAKALFVTQPSISKAIHELEADLQITIFERNNRGVLFTGQGAELLAYARMLLEQEENIRYHFRKETKTLRFSVSSQHFNFLAAAGAEFLKILGSTEYALSFSEGKAADVIGHVALGHSVLGIISISSQNEELLKRTFEEQTLSFHPMAKLPEHVFLGKHHPLAGLQRISLEQLSTYPCLTYRKDDMPLDLAEESLNGQRFQQFVYIQDRGTMDSLLVHTHGYNLGTGCLSPGFTHPDIIAIPLDMPWQVHVGWLCKAGQVLTTQAEVFLECLDKALKQALPR